MAERPATPPTVEQLDSLVADTRDRHPAFGMISVARWHGGQNRLFDSDIEHSDTIVVQVSTAYRDRSSGSHDYIHQGDEIVEVQMSMAQWASFVSSMNTTGVPCTIRRHRTPVEPAHWTIVDQIDEEPRLAMTMNETRRAAHRAHDAIATALAAYEQALTDKAPAKDRNEALRTLRARVTNATANVNYAAKTLAEHAEDVVQKARADVEAMAARHHERLTEIGAGEATWSIPALEAHADPEPS
jgi:hypothetical protein